MKKDARMQGMPADLDEVQIEDLIAEFTGHLAIAPGASSAHAPGMPSAGDHASASMPSSDPMSQQHPGRTAVPSPVCTSGPCCLVQHCSTAVRECKVANTARTLCCGASEVMPCRQRDCVTAQLEFAMVELGCLVAVVEIGEALKRFVEKDEKSALSEAYNKILKDTQEAALDDLGKAAAGNEDEPAVGDAADAEDAAERQVIDAVHAAGRRLQAEAIAKFAEADVRLRLAEQDAQREDPEGGGDENVAQAGAALRCAAWLHAGLLDYQFHMVLLARGRVSAHMTVEVIPGSGGLQLHGPPVGALGMHCKPCDSCEFSGGSWWI